MRPLISFSILLVLPLFIGFSSRNTADTSNDHDYCNARFDFCLNYPTAVFTQTVNSDNDDGISLSSADGLLNAQVYGVYNVEDASILNLYQELVDKLAGMNKRVEVVSSDVNITSYEATFRGDKEVQYYRTVLQPNNVIVTLMIAVPTGMEEMLHSLLRDMVLDTHS
ncbi:MAG: hypothetical protein IPM82_31315 [Saprospiraceae bacterium]|nr:hypothetical protein [Saprospiraceae bacterium]